MRRSKKTPKLRVTGLCAGNSPVTGEFAAQMASNAESVSSWWRHHECKQRHTGVRCQSHSGELPIMMLLETNRSRDVLICRSHHNRIYMLDKTHNIDIPDLKKTRNERYSTRDIKTKWERSAFALERPPAGGRYNYLSMSQYQLRYITKVVSGHQASQERLNWYRTDQGQHCWNAHVRCKNEVP